jgi:hypothetical protein
MNGWNGLAINPMIGMAGMNMGASAPYMTPAAGAEVLSPMARAPALTPLNTFAPTATPGLPATPGMFGIEGLGMNLDTMKLGLGGLQSLAGIWNAMEQNKLAKKSFSLNEGILNTNLANQIKSYNLTLDDKLRSRQVVEGSSDAAREEARRRWEARDERKR